MKNSKMYRSLIPHLNKMDNDLQLITAQIIAGERVTRAELAKRVGKSKSWVNSYAIPRIKFALKDVAVIESSKRRNNAGYHLRLLNTIDQKQPIDQSNIRSTGIASPGDGAGVAADAISIRWQILSHFQKNPCSVIDASEIVSIFPMTRPTSIRANLNMLYRDGQLERVSPGRFRLARDVAAADVPGTDLGPSEPFFLDIESDEISCDQEDQLELDLTQNLSRIDEGLMRSSPSSEVALQIQGQNDSMEKPLNSGKTLDGATGDSVSLASRLDQESVRLPLWFIPPWTGAIDLRYVVAVDVSDGRLMVQLNKGGYSRGPKHPDAERVAAAMIEAVTKVDGARTIVYGVKNNV